MTWMCYVKYRMEYLVSNSGISYKLFLRLSLVTVTDVNQSIVGKVDFKVTGLVRPLAD